MKNSGNNNENRNMDAIFLGRTKSFFSQVLLVIKFLLKGKASQSFFMRIKISYFYFKFKAKDVFFKNIVRKEIKSENLFDYNVKFSNYSIFRSLFMEIFILEQYYFETQKAIPCIIDCGANIGVSVLYFKFYYPNSKIVAFEPDVDSFKLLEENIRSNKLNDVQVHNLALSNQEGKLKFYTDKTNSIVNSAIIGVKEVIYDGNLLVKEVQSEKLSKFINGEVDLLKIDVEGYEDKVVLDLKKEDKLKFVKNIIVEYHPGICEELKTGEVFMEFLNSNRFNCIAKKMKWKNYLVYGEKI